jgi:GNAT superfamily N-acetyltransferase
MRPGHDDVRVATPRSAPVYTMQRDPWVAELRVREATSADNDALLDLAAACDTRGAVDLRVEREPEFLALNRLEADGWRVGVANGLTPRSVAGCVSVSPRRVYIDGSPRLTAYAGDFKVHPAHRGGGAGDALTAWACDVAREWGGDDIPGLLTVLAGNAPMERRSEGPRGLPVFTRFATIRSHAIPFVWARPAVTSGARVSVARESDIEEMAALWARVAPDRQFAPVHSAASLARWITGTPGLGIESFWVARDQQGRIAGFLAAWDQSSFKQVRVSEYPRKLALMRAGINALTPVTRATPLPDVGDELRWLTAANICVPSNAPGVLRALVLGVYAAMRTRGYSCLNIGLDIRDPLAVAVDGLMAQPTEIHAYITTPGGAYTGPSLRTLPLHHEIALV